MAAVNKVITMLEDSQAQVLKEGEEEAASYNKFACFCKDTTKDKTESINKGTDDDERLSTSIEDKNSHRNDLDDEIKDLEEEIESEESEMKEATKEREETNAVFLKNAGDLEAALSGLEGAIQVLKKSKPALVQVAEARKTVKGIAELADAMGLGSNEQVSISSGLG
jgi:septal ring factor EnvC (AmiA/AmiB activator)